MLWSDVPIKMIIMTLKQSLKPDRRKIVVFAVLSIISSTYPMTFGVGELYFPYRGLPLPVYACIEGFSDVNLKTPPMRPCEIFYQFLIINLIISYLLSCLIVWIYDKFRKK